MELTKLQKLIPIKAIPEQELNTALLTYFLPWLSRLLSLNDERSANKLETAFPAIKKHCWGMGVKEMEKMFEMYADGQLEIKPRSNYFDRVLLGQIVESYKKQKPKKKTANIIEKVYSDEEKENIIYCGLVTCYDEWVQSGKIYGAFVWKHDYLMKRKILNFPYDIKLKLWKQAKKNILNKSKDRGYNEYKKMIYQIEQKDHTTQEIEYMYLRLQEFFKQIKEQNKHIKDFI